MRFSFVLAALALTACNTGLEPAAVAPLQTAGADSKALFGGTVVQPGDYAHHVFLERGTGIACHATIVDPNHVVTNRTCAVQMDLVVTLPGTAFTFHAIEEVAASGHTDPNLEVVVLRTQGFGLASDLDLVTAGGVPALIIDRHAAGDFTAAGSGGVISGVNLGGRQLEQVPAFLDGTACEAIGEAEDALCVDSFQAFEECNGDSGSPLVVATEQGYALAGIGAVSGWCATPQSSHDIFLRVSSVAELILAATDAQTVEVPVVIEPRDDHGNSFPTATSIAVDGSFELTAQLEAGDVDMFRIASTMAGTLRVESFGPDLHGSLYTLAGQLITQDDDSGFQSGFALAAELELGEVYLMVRGYNGNVSGNYTLNFEHEVPEVSTDDDHGDHAETATWISSPSIGQTVQIDGVIDDVDDWDTFAIHLPEDARLVLSSLGGTDTAGWLMDASWNELQSNDLPQGFRIERNHAAAGFYYVTIAGDVGPYTLEVSVADAIDAGSELWTARSVEMYDSVTEGIFGGDVDYFSIYVPFDGRYTISAGNTDVDIVGVLRSPDGVMIGQDGTFPSVEFDLELERGTYLLEIQTFASDAQEGTYTVAAHRTVN